jgi:hypothetical protein
MLREKERNMNGRIHQEEEERDGGTNNKGGKCE